MKKEWIMSDEARIEKKQRVQENRERRLAEVNNTTSVHVNFLNALIESLACSDALLSVL